MKIIVSRNENSLEMMEMLILGVLHRSRSMGVRVILVVELKERAYICVCRKGDASSNIIALVGEKTQHLTLSFVQWHFYYQKLETVPWL